MRSPVCVIQNHPVESAGTTVDFLADQQIPFTEVHTYRGDPFPALENIAAVLVMGCPTSVTELEHHPFLIALRSFVSEVVRLNTPFLGVCFGGQLLARVLGAQVRRNPVREIGVYRTRLTGAGRTDPLFRGFEPEFDVFHWHGDTFDIPSVATLLATGETCTNQAFRRGMAVGLQFHLETSSADVPLWCDEYARELDEEGKTKADIVRSFENCAQALQTANYRLLNNFFATIR
ncbi:MAG: type 1 glutamine amidotransferase [candidate division Zixibacteria bacterium]|nr:type 1 glutamine amidotransferase [candidate division Zixibacteria bacterium]